MKYFLDLRDSRRDIIETTDDLSKFRWLRFNGQFFDQVTRFGRNRRTHLDDKYQWQELTTQEVFIEML